LTKLRTCQYGAKLLVTKLQLGYSSEEAPASLPWRDWEAGASQLGFPNQSLGTSEPLLVLGFTLFNPTYKKD
jgi:hypothetical protein